MSDLIQILDVETAQRTVLRRRPWDEVEITPALQAGIERVFGKALTPDQAVAQVLDDVRRQGDAAVRDYERRITGAEIDSLLVTEGEMDAAWAETSVELRRALQLAVPARVAGVEQVIVASPPRGDGRVAPVLLAAARVAGVDGVYRAGGAQAIGAMAYGTETIPRVDKIVGPGSLFVILAKRRVYGQVAIDGLPGPTETLVIADDAADPATVAADLLAQAEHDVLASPICITPSSALAEQVQLEMARQIESLDRAEIIVQALRGQGGIVLTADLAQAMELANAYAPEHLCLLVRDPWAWVGQVRNAGGVFVGESASEALGDYVVGPTHIMPTGGTARFASPCNVWDYVKITSVFAPAQETVQQISPHAAALARAEGLTAHAAAIEMRQGMD
jgi:histidinol dehydrogenase